MLENQPLANKNSGDALGVLIRKHSAEALDGREETQHAEREDGEPAKLHHLRAFNNVARGAIQARQNARAIKRWHG